MAKMVFSGVALVFFIFIMLPLDIMKCHSILKKATYCYDKWIYLTDKVYFGWKGKRLYG